MNASVRHIALVGTALVLCHCASARGVLPTPPTQQDLANDGTAQEKARVHQKYAVRLERDRIRVGDAETAVSVLGGSPLSAAFLSTGFPEPVQHYLQSDPDSAQALPGFWSFLLSTGASCAVYPWSIATLLVHAALFSMPLVVLGVMAVTLPQGVQAAAAGVLLTIPLAAALMVAALTMQAGIFMLAMPNVWESQQRQQAVQVFNRNLQRRIDAAADACHGAVAGEVCAAPCASGAGCAPPTSGDGRGAGADDDAR
jgi:hypothetical protein